MPQTQYTRTLSYRSPSESRRNRESDEEKDHRKPATITPLTLELSHLESEDGVLELIFDLHSTPSTLQKRIPLETASTHGFHLVYWDWSVSTALGRKAASAIVPPGVCFG